MKSKSLVSGRFALSGVAAAALCLVMSDVWALGLGRVVVQSSLGESLRAEIEVASLTADEASNLRVRIATPDAYRAAGIEYNAVLPGTQVVLQRRSDGRPYLRLTSDRVVQEPFIDVILELNWNTGRLVREYTMLFDPPRVQAQAPAAAPATSPVIAAAPAPSEQRPPVPPREARPAAPPPLAVRAPEGKPAEAIAVPAPEPRKPPAAAVAASSDGYRVKPGDTLSGIAGQTQPQGISLDQMLVAYLNANPQAFVDNNMNRLKAGAVLKVPDAATAAARPTSEARQIIQAQSADFAAYRQRLAGAVPAAGVAGASRQASGKVQAAVQDRKQAAAQTPDKLLLSKGSVSPQVSAAEASVSKDRESKDAATRTAELKKNVDELQKLAAGAAAPAPAAATATAPSASAAASVASSPAPVVVATATVPQTTTAAAASAPVAKAAASRPTLAPTPPTSAEPGLMDTLLEDPLALSGGGVVLALLAGFGIYRYARRSKKDSGETSFLESRLQPDSFFGVSGGQRIDTREAPTGQSSSMSYSLSQLDAIGDVDPVAEADVYLAYGRDLQAEEILKEAMRGNPDRLPIRTKLLEVYAKRRDIKGFGQLAKQLFSLTNGEGEDWAKAQELGAQIDPDNALYLPGGRPELPAGADDRPIEPLGASTMPQSVLPSPSQFGEVGIATEVMLPAANEEVDLDLDLDLGLDLDLDAPAPANAATPQMPEVTQPLPAISKFDDELSTDFDLPLEAPPEPFASSRSEPARDLSLDFDLAGISLDLDAPVPAESEASGRLPEADALDLSDLSEDGSDPFERKLELAEEFRQIGDMEGARDLLQEVVAGTGGAIRAKAQNMLDSLN